MVEAIKEKYEEAMRVMIRKYANITNSENCSGDFIDSSRNCLDCYDVNDSEDCRYVQVGVNVKDNYDCSNMYLKPELCYGTLGTIEVYHSAYCLFVFQSKILGTSDTNQAIGYIRKYPTTYPKIKSVLDSIINSYNTSKIKLGSGGKNPIPTSNISKKNKTSASKGSGSNQSTSTTNSTSKSVTPPPLPNVTPKTVATASNTTIPNGATIKSGTGNVLTYNGTTWVQSNGIPLNATQSKLVSKKYLNQTPSTIPESIVANNITYKEFFD
jgi:hypothetical protein